MPKRDHAAELARYLDRGGDVFPALRSLPRDIDVKLATAVVLKVIDSNFRFGRSCQNLPAPVIRAVRKLGRCLPAELPAWLTKVARRLKVEWQLGSIGSNLRGARRARLEAWLLPAAQRP